MSSASTDSFVRSITHLKDQPRGNEALDMLKRIAALAKPIMRKRNWHLPTLGEFLPDDPRLLGINVNQGHQIFLRLRPADRPGTFYDLEFVMGTMLHELTHNFRGPHDEAFYKYLDGLEDEYAALKRSGYSGEGFYSKGRRLGGKPGGRLGGGAGIGGSRLVSAPAPSTGRVMGNAPALSAAEKRRAAEAAEARRQGARVLGGQPLPATRAPLSPREAAAQAALRRVRDAKACASAAQGEAQKEAQKATQASEVIDLTLNDESDDEDILIVEGKPGPSRQSRRRGGPVFDDDDDDIEVVFDGTLQRPASTSGTKVQGQAVKLLAGQSPARAFIDCAVPQRWACGICTLLNGPDALQCEACAAIRPANQIGHWTCLRCGETPIPSDFWSCGYCGLVKPTS
ncbi:WLM domain-containing protein [Schizophyllum amplum]|uniref:WLM domain-containing protein n=1 Tax=Schizophyllum amplum TaxID=97359 RepID=A0A550CM02_9AGAR|nr:WLM domain-containing protein [Auriculariopsis ampla]